jgi:hypothetical protein
MSFLAPLGLAWLALLADPTTQPAPERPEPCSEWKGTAHGNDPSVSLTASLCDAGDGRVRGTITWQSHLSGSSVREVKGAWSSGGQTLTLRDVKLSGSPNAGWRFCPIDRYRLSLSGDELTGTYHSSACQDDATLTLTRVH